MTKTLTEQWRGGTLAEGLYYIEGKGNYDIALIRNRYFHVLTSPYCEDDVFEPEFVPVARVPSYDEHNELKQDNKYLKSGIETRDKQIEQLEKRLKIATDALNGIRDVWANNPNKFSYIARIANRKAKRALEEMEGVK